MLKIDQFCSVAKLNFWDNYFQTAAYHKQTKILTWNQSYIKLKIPLFHNMKEAYIYLKPLLTTISWKGALSCRIIKKRCWLIPSASTVPIATSIPVFFVVCPSFMILIKKHPGVRKQTDEITWWRSRMNCSLLISMLHYNAGND